MANFRCQLDKRWPPKLVKHALCEGGFRKRGAFQSMDQVRKAHPRPLWAGTMQTAGRPAFCPWTSEVQVTRPWVLDRVMPLASLGLQLAETYCETPQSQ